MDLIAPGDLDRFDCRHVADSLRALDLVRSAPPGPAVDVGSGAGLPGIPLAISDPDRAWRLLEPRRRRAAFLEQVVRELGLSNCEVVAATAEAAIAGGMEAAHAVAVARALAPPDKAAQICRPLVAPGGMVVLFVGRDAEPLANATVVTPGLIRIDV
jgi:16S rRNA (guanine527-N7)-methyltransferase